MKTVKNAKRIALRAWSMWFNYIGIALLIAPEAIYLIWQIDTNPRIWWISGLVAILLGIAGRLIDQGMTRSPAAIIAAALFMAMAQVPDRSRTGAGPEPEASVMDVAVPLIAKWEGLRTTAYLDTIASPPLWTVCYGETKGVQPGDSYTEAECRAMLAREVRDYWQGWRAYLTPETIAERLHAAREAAYTSLAYNVGIRAAGRSTATRRLNAGNIAGGCEAIGWWNRAGQRVVRGLVNRRADEVAMCRLGLA